MRVERKREGKKFEPITLEITLETIEEVYDLWHRTNMSLSVVRGDQLYSSPSSYPTPGKECGMGLWLELDEILNET